MAVQAQYPSNVLLLNRSIQEGNNTLGNDYSLQPQSGGSERGGGGFLDQSQMFFNNGAVMGTNYARKRGREGSMNPLVSMQLPNQPSQLIDLTQLHTPPPPPNVVSTGLRLAFGDHHHQQQQFQRQQQQQSQSQTQQQQQQSTLSHQSSALSSLLSEDLASQIKQQRDEIEHFLHAQGEQLRQTLAERRQTHYRALLGAAEESLTKRLKAKEAEVEKATRCNAELEARAVQLSAEAQLWQNRARVQQTRAATLQAQLQHAIMSGGCTQQQDKEEGGGCGVGEAEDAESAYVDPDRVVVSTGPSCKVCGKRVASVVLLPCRHLCICTGCDSVVQACPVCLSFRCSSVEVFLC